MTLSENDLKELSKISKEAVLKAGEIITYYQDRNVVVNKKDIGSSIASSVVTEVDLKCQNEILKVLRNSINHYDLGLLAEESIDNSSRFEKDYFWSIDPLDGTLPFTEKKNGYSVSIALVSKEGMPVIGTVYNPEKNLLYSAIKGYGSFKNMQVLKIATNNSEKLSLYIHRSFLIHPQYKQYIKKINESASSLGINYIEITSHAGSVMNACWLIENHPALYFAIPKNKKGGGNLWDYSASSLIVQEAGGYASDFFGDPIELNRKESTYLNHKGILMTTDQALTEICHKLI